MLEPGWVLLGCPHGHSVHPAERGQPFHEWKAAALNRLFSQAGGQRCGITGATIKDGEGKDGRV